MIKRDLVNRRLPESTQVRAHYCMILRKDVGHLVPGDMRPGMSVQQEDCWPATADTNAKGRVREANPLQSETFKHLFEINDAAQGSRRNRNGDRLAARN